MAVKFYPLWPALYSGVIQIIQSGMSDDAKAREFRALAAK